jgi:hypothetical protein
MLGIATFLQPWLYSSFIPELKLRLSSIASINLLLTNIIGSICITSAFVLVPLFLYEKYFWVKFHRKIYMRGKWSYKCTFYPIAIGKLKKTAYTELQKNVMSLCSSVEGQVLISQEIHSLDAYDGHGDVKVNDKALITTWKSLNIDISDKGNVHIYFVTNMGGTEFKGIDQLLIAKRDKLKRPTEMRGHFIMIPEGEDITLKGEIAYTKI